MMASHCDFMSTRSPAVYPKQEGRRVCKERPCYLSMHRDQEQASLMASQSIRPSAGPQVHH